MVYVSRKEHFNAAHMLFNPDWTEEKNDEVFGLCANKNWHGHNFELVVTVCGEPDIHTGFVVDMKRLGNLIQQHIIQEVDHKNLNIDVGFLKGKMPTCEIVIQEFWKILYPLIPTLSRGAILYKIILYETPKNYVEYMG
ncbi:MAG: 6-carboxytetrahydropterin synthase [Chitinophagaceae bacterium]|nr:6-carboxytetrahydropterin synthase [Chitinophagaceae bacterium]